MIKISNAIPRDMTTDGGDCWPLLKLREHQCPTAQRAGQGPARAEPAQGPARPQLTGRGPEELSPTPAPHLGPHCGGGPASSPELSCVAGQQQDPAFGGQGAQLSLPLTSGGARLQQAGAVRREAGRGHGGERQQGLRCTGSGAGAGGAWLEHADGRRLLGRRGALSGVLIVRQVDPLAEAGPRGLAGGEVAVRGQQALAEALPAAGSRSPRGSAPTTGGPEPRLPSPRGRGAGVRDC